ncbi:toll/interleukin-1 receptor domain-containing protein [Nocardia sp. NPDC004068]|uniref:toll/interleukin-1 receptor domain-containing protein n=1 Tax=Nocardia sp. NPDC004068 TaxID=3364303 RepID=UPI0036B3AD82
MHLADTRTSADIDIFLSYSRAADRELAPALQRCLARLAKPWNKPRALRVFRDRTDLSAASSLTAEIETALRGARYFLLLASPEAAASKWVGREIAYWQQHKSPDTFLVAVTDGVVAWDEASGDFDWAVTTALPTSLTRYFASEPIWEDLRFARGSDQLSLQHSEFRSAVASLAAPVRGLPKGVLDSEDVRQQRTVARLRNAAIVGLATLLVIAIATGIGFLAQRDDARHQRDVAVTRQLVADSRNLANTDPELSRLLAVAAVELDAAAEGDNARAALRTALLNPLRHVIRHQQLMASALSPDGRVLATGSNDGTVRLTDVRSGRQVGAFTAAASVNFALAFSPDGRKLATGSVDNTTAVWDVATGKSIYTLNSGGPGNFYKVAFSPDGSTLATSTGNNTTILWNAENGTLRTTFDDSNAAEFSPDGTIIATGGDRGVVHLWNPATGERLAELTGDANSVNALVFSADSALLAVGVLGPTTRVWDTRTHELRHTLDNGSVAWGHMFSPDGRTFATGSETEHVVRLWDIVSGTVRTTLVGERISFGSGTLAATSDSDGHIRLWDSATGQRLADLSGHTGAAKRIEFTPDGATIASMSDDDSVRLWHPIIGRPTALRGTASDALAADVGHGKVLGPTLSPNGSVLATKGSPARLWDAATGRLRAAIQTHHPGAVRPEFFGPTGTILATTEDDSDWVQLWDLDARKLLTDIPVGRFGALAIDGISADGTVLATSGQESIRLWDTASKKLMNEHPAAANSRTVLTPDGRAIVAVDKSNHALQVWDVRSGALRKTLPGQPSVGRVEAISPDGTTVATVDGRVVHLWNLTADTSKTLTGYTNSIFPAVFAADSAYLATGDNDHLVRLWDVHTGLLLTEPLAGHQTTVRDVAISPEGRTLSTVADDATIFTWDVGALTGDLRGNACAQVGRGLTAEERERYLSGVDPRVCGL